MGKPIEINPSYFLKTNTWRYGQRVIIKARIAGFSRRVRNVPKQINVTEIVTDPNKNPRTDKVDFSDPRNYDMLRNYMYARTILMKTLKDYYKAMGWDKFKFDESDERLNMIDLVIRDIHPERSGETFVYNDFPVIMIGESLPPYSKCYLEGYLIDDDKNRTTALIYSVRPIAEDFENLIITDEDKSNFEKYFKNTNSLVRNIDRTIDPKIVGREFAKLAVALALHSPIELNFIGTKIRGELHALLLGDSKSGKSDIMTWIMNMLNIGEYGTGEAGKRTGLLFTVDTERDAIIWGLLVQADRRLALIDGLQRLSSEEIGEFREALRQKKIVVRMKVSGEAPARCRIIAAANPNRPLEEYVDLAEAIRDTKTFYDPVDITRWDIFVRFHARDVPDEDIAKAENVESSIPIHVFRKHVLWAWGLKPDDIVFTPEAVKRIREIYIETVRYSTPRLPMVHKGYMEVIARISAAFAILTHNINNNKVYITVGDVDKAYEFIDQMLSQWEYREYVVRIESSLELTEAEYKNILSTFDLSPIIRQTFLQIANNQGIRLSVLAEKLGEGRGSILSAIAKLKALNLAESETKHPGYRLTKKGVSLFRKMSEKPDMETVKKELYKMISEGTKNTNRPLTLEEIKVYAKSLDITDSSLITDTLNILIKEGHIQQIGPWSYKVIRKST